MAVGVGIVVGACFAGTAGLCAGLTPLLTTVAIGAIGAIGGAATYSIDDTVTLRVVMLLASAL